MDDQLTDVILREPSPTLRQFRVFSFTFIRFICVLGRTTKSSPIICVVLAYAGRVVEGGSVSKFSILGCLEVLILISAFLKFSAKFPR